MIALVEPNKLISGVLKKILLSKFPDEEVSLFHNDNPSQIIEANSLRGLIIRAENANESYSYSGLKLYESLFDKEGLPVPIIISFDSLEHLSATEYGYLLTEEYRNTLFYYLQMPFRLSLLMNLIKGEKFK